MDVVQAGVDHHRAPLDVRERMTVPAERLQGVLAALSSEPWLSEAMVVSTCNRTEAYAVSNEPDASSLLVAALRRALPSSPREDDPAWVRRTGEDAAFHLLRVAAGLDSAVLGETEIAGQVREAHRAALEAHAAGALLDRLASVALRAGKRARTETGLSRGALSHGHAAFDVTRRVFGDLSKRVVLVVGAGEMAASAARALAGLEGGRFVVANRTAEAAVALAATLPEGRATTLGEVSSLLATAHVAVFAAAGEPLTRAACEPIVSRRRDPLLVFDYGVPRCVDPGVGEIPGVFRYDLEAIEQLLARSLASRREAVPAADAILTEEFDAFRAWHRSRAAVPAIRSLHAWAEEIRSAEVAHLGNALSPGVLESVERVTRRIVERILRRPAARVRQAAEEGDPALPTTEHLRSVFGLDDDAARSERRRTATPTRRTGERPPGEAT